MKKTKAVKKAATVPVDDGLLRVFIFAGSPREAEEIQKRFRLGVMEIVILKDAEPLKGTKEPLVLQGVGWHRHSHSTDIRAVMMGSHASVWEERL